jgi:hypothetical protein
MVEYFIAAFKPYKLVAVFEVIKADKAACLVFSFFKISFKLFQFNIFINEPLIKINPNTQNNKLPLHHTSSVSNSKHNT